MKKIIVIIFLIMGLAINAKAQYAYVPNQQDNYTITGGFELMERGTTTLIAGSIVTGVGSIVSTIGIMGGYPIMSGVGIATSIIGGVVCVCGCGYLISGLHKSTTITGNGVNITFGTKRNMSKVVVPTFSKEDIVNLRHQTKNEDNEEYDKLVEKYERYSKIIKNNEKTMELYWSNTAEYKIMKEQNDALTKEMREIEKKLKREN